MEEVTLQPVSKSPNRTTKRADTLSNVTQKDFILFKEEFLKLFRAQKEEFKKRLTNELVGYKQKITSLDDPYESLKSMGERYMTKVDFADEKNDIFQEIKRVDLEIKNTLTNHHVSIEGCQKDILEACSKYDKIVTDNLLIPGIIGHNCKFLNLKDYLTNLNDDFQNMQTAFKKAGIDMSSYKNKLDNLLNLIKIELKTFSSSCQEYTNKKISDFDKKMQSQFDVIHDRIKNLNIENNRYVKELLDGIKDLNSLKQEIITSNKKTLNSVKKLNDDVLDKLNEEKEEYIKLKKNILEFIEALTTSQDKTAKNSMVNNFNQMIGDILKDWSPSEKKKTNVNKPSIKMHAESVIKNYIHEHSFRRLTQKKPTLFSTKDDIEISSIDAKKHFKDLKRKNTMASILGQSSKFKEKYRDIESGVPASDKLEGKNLFNSNTYSDSLSLSKFKSNKILYNNSAVFNKNEASIDKRSLQDSLKNVRQNASTNTGNMKSLKIKDVSSKFGSKKLSERKIIEENTDRKYDIQNDSSDFGDGEGSSDRAKLIRNMYKNYENVKGFEDDKEDYMVGKFSSNKSKSKSKSRLTSGEVIKSKLGSDDKSKKKRTIQFEDERKVTFDVGNDLPIKSRMDNINKIENFKNNNINPIKIQESFKKSMLGAIKKDNISPIHKTETDEYNKKLNSLDTIEESSYKIIKSNNINNQTSSLINKNTNGSIESNDKPETTEKVTTQTTKLTSIHKYRTPNPLNNIGTNNLYSFEIAKNKKFTNNFREIPKIDVRNTSPDLNSNLRKSNYFSNRNSSVTEKMPYIDSSVYEPLKSRKFYRTIYQSSTPNNSNIFYPLNFYNTQTNKNDDVLLSLNLGNGIRYLRDDDIIDIPLLANQPTLEIDKSKGPLENRLAELEYFFKKKIDELVLEIKNFIPIHFNSRTKDYIIDKKPFK